jgi:hypothetical protein
MTSNTRRTITQLVAAIALGLGGIVAAGTAASADPGNGAGGVTGPAFYVDGELYRTVGTPTDFARTNAPDSSFDTIYSLPGVPNVAEAKPGDRDFNGGRWQVHAVSFDDFDAALTAADANDSGTFDSAEEVEAAIELGLAHDGGVVKAFECPVIHVKA